MKKLILSFIFLLNFSCSIFASVSALQYEVVPFDYTDDDMREQICAMVRDDQDIQDMTYETEESMRIFLSRPDLKHKSNCFVCRAVDGSGTMYGYMMYVMSPAAYFVKNLDVQEKSLLFNATYLDEYEIFEPIRDFVNFGFLDNFAVQKDYRGQGIAQAMLDYFEQDCRRNGMESLISGVETKNHKARRLYHNFGFQQHPEFTVVMVKKLD